VQPRLLVPPALSTTNSCSCCVCLHDKAARHLGAALMHGSSLVLLHDKLYPPLLTLLWPLGSVSASLLLQVAVKVVCHCTTGREGRLPAVIKWRTVLSDEYLVYLHLGAVAPGTPPPGIPSALGMGELPSAPMPDAVPAQPLAGCLTLSGASRQMYMYVCVMRM
jgi:hypothetical protein